MFEHLQGAKIKDIIEYVSDSEAVIRLDNEEVLYVFSLSSNIKQHLEQMRALKIDRLILCTHKCGRFF